MALALLILLLACAANFLELPLFETVAGSLLATVALAFPIGKCVGLDPLTYAAILAAIYCVLLTIRIADNRPLRWVWRREEFFTIGVWLLVFAIAHGLCMLWPDFVSMGERLRDYAILSSVVQHPLEAREPWMSGAVLNYYLFWYRFGHFLAALGTLHIWDVYHELMAFSISLYFTCFYRFTSRYLHFKHFSAAACAALISFGSNIAGIHNFAFQDANWWGPSRVIPGAIDEFPVWSFLLGDLHPHFLNLPFMPLCMLCGLAVASALRRFSWYVLGSLGALAMGVVLVWIFGANAWELPFAAIVLTCAAVGTTIFYGRITETPALSPASKFATATTIALACICFAIAVHGASKNITPPGDPLRLVTLPIAPEAIAGGILAVAHGINDSVTWAAGLVSITVGPLIHIEPPIPAATGTDVHDLLRHWGFPLGLIAASLLILSASRLDAVAKLGALLFGYFSGSALIFLFVLVALVVWRLFELRFDGPIELGALTIELIGLAALFAVIFPEILFVDDPYGGENERMNTIFKFYSASWGFLHLYAFALTAKVLGRIRFLQTDLKLYSIGWIVVLTTFLGFFATSMKYRESPRGSLQPYEQGLSMINEQYPGAGEAIQQLEALPRGTVIEAVEGAYNFSSMIATLSANESFLGWRNHIDLLTKQFDESARREEVAKKFYTAASCDERREIMQREHVSYAVLGILENQTYGGIDPAGFNCLRTVVQAKEYRIFVLQ